MNSAAYLLVLHLLLGERHSCEELDEEFILVLCRLVCIFFIGGAVVVDEATFLFVTAGLADVANL